MKRILAMLLAGVMIFALCACEDTSLLEITEKKVIIAGFDAGHIPFGYQTENGAYAGFDLDLAQKVAAKLGVTLNLRVLEAEAKDFFQSDSLDLLAGNQSLLAGDARGMVATDALFVNKIVVAVRTGAGVETVSQLEGKKVGIVSGGASEEAFNGKRELKSKSEKVEFATASEALAALEDGSVDAIVADEMFIRAAVKDGASVLMLEEALEERSYSLMVRKGDNALKERINEILFELYSDGTLQDLSIKWFGADVISLNS